LVLLASNPFRVVADVAFERAGSSRADGHDPCTHLNAKSPALRGFSLIQRGLHMAIPLEETEGFEPSMRLLTTYSLSRGAPSATRSRLPGNPAILAQLDGRFWQSCRSFHSTSVQASSKGASRPKTRCNARTASSMYFSSSTTEVLISLVVIIWMLMPSSDSVRNIVLATPA
jgi:hypothetical protein